MYKYHIRAFILGFIPAFSCFIILWMAVFLLVRPGVSSPVNTEFQDENSTEENVYLPQPEDSMTLLLCTDRPAPKLFFLLRFAPAKGNIFVAAFPKTLMLSLENVSESADKIYEQNGIRTLQQAFTETFHIPTDHYVTVSLDILPQLLDRFSSTKVRLSKDFPTKIHDTPVILQKGPQDLNASQLIAWILSGTPKDAPAQTYFLSKIFADCINQHRSLLSVENSAKLFSAVVNLCDSDLHHQDYSSRKQAAAFLGEICPTPAKALALQFETQPDGTCFLTEESRKLLCRCFA